MNWYFEWAGDRSEVRVWDHEAVAGDDPTLIVNNPDAPAWGEGPQGIPTTPDVRQEVYEYLYNRGQADVYALVSVGAALTGAGFEEGTP